jgi:hypothetical protein
VENVRTWRADLHVSYPAAPAVSSTTAHIKAPSVSTDFLQALICTRAALDQTLLSNQGDAHSI